MLSPSRLMELGHDFGEAREALQKWGEELDRILGADVGAWGVELARGADR
jgi:hypothetical protein